MYNRKLNNGCMAQSHISFVDMLRHFIIDNIHHQVTNRGRSIIIHGIYISCHKAIGKRLFNGIAHGSSFFMCIKMIEHHGHRKN